VCDTDAITSTGPEAKGMDHPASGSLRLRLTGALVFAALVGILLERGVAEARPDAPLLSLMLGLAAVTAVGLTACEGLLRGLLRSNDDLQVRYETALADALTDPLTRLGNHRAFQEELDRQVEQALRYETPLALVLIDLDDFKAINDERGHAGGDAVLARLGELIVTVIRKPDRAFRIGGDELALLLPHADAEGARIVARRLLAAALGPKQLGGDLADGLSFSAGVSSIPELAMTRSDLYAQADAALYGAKRGGRTAVDVFAVEALEPVPASDRSAAVSQLIAARQLLGVYQPIVDLATRAVIGYEGLVRPLPPSPFATPLELFAAAEAGGRTVALDLACIELLVAGARDLPVDQFLSVNLSPRTVEAPEFGVATLLNIAARHSLAAQRLVIELTEHVSISDMPRLRDKLEACRRAGIRLAADDLGAGNAGLRLLSELQFDILKVDVNLVRRSAPGALSSAIVSSVIDLATRTGALVVAEGIEDELQLDRLTSLGAHAAQGFLLGRPGPLPERSVRPMVSVAVATGPMASWRESIGLPIAGVGSA
jgi:diguanylate cyclase (GGDEF)-like protein